MFVDYDFNGHGEYQDNLAGSPWIDLEEAGVTGAPGKLLRTEGYFELPLLNYIFTQSNVKYYPKRCDITGGLIETPWTSTGFVNYFGSVPQCRDVNAPVNFDFSAIIDPGAERAKIALGVLTYCRFYANCTGQTNTTPWFDNVRLGVYGTPGAPFISMRSLDIAQDRSRWRAASIRATPAASTTAS